MWSQCGIQDTLSWVCEHFLCKCSYWKGRSPAPAGLSEALPHISSSLKYLDNIDNSIWCKFPELFCRHEPGSLHPSTKWRNYLLPPAPAPHPQICPLKMLCQNPLRSWRLFRVWANLFPRMALQQTFLCSKLRLFHCLALLWVWHRNSH